MPRDGGSRAAKGGGLARGNDVCKIMLGEAGCSRVAGLPDSRTRSTVGGEVGECRSPGNWHLGALVLDKTQLFPKLKACARAPLGAFGSACNMRCVRYGAAMLLNQYVVYCGGALSCRSCASAAPSPINVCDEQLPLAPRQRCLAGVIVPRWIRRCCGIDTER